MKKRMIFWMIPIVMISLLACSGKREANQKSGADSLAKVLATVNDAPITEYDMKLSMKKIAGHGEGINPQTGPNALQSLVRNELIYQKSLELGLDKNPVYRQKVSEAEAQLAAVKRQEMSALFFDYVRSKSEVSDSEAQAYFERNAARIQTKHHILQIFYRGNNPQLARDYQDLKGGMPFEKVAARRFPNLPKDAKSPWDLGYLSWNQIPEPWQGVIDRLETGKMSDIIQGLGDRYWVLKLVDKNVDPKITFAMERGKIVEVLRKKKADELYESMISEMKTRAKIVFPK